MSKMVLRPQGAYEAALESCERLTTIPLEEGGWAEYFAPGTKMEMKNEMLRAQTAMLLENAKWQMAQQCGNCRALDEHGRWLIDETTRSALVGGFSDHIFPVIRAGFPTNPVNDLVSVQPTTRRVAQIVYWNWIIGRGKGSYSAGQRLFDSQTGKQSSGYDLSSERIDREAITALASANVTNTGTLTFNDGGGIRPGTVRITATVDEPSGTATAREFVDNGNGEFISADVTVAASSINYLTGAWSITVTVTDGTGFTTAATNWATYEWDSEGSDLVPQVDVQIITSTAEVRRRAMRINYTVESMQDVMAEFGVSLEPQLVTGVAEQMNDEIARQIISEIWRVAPISSTFTKTPPGATPQYTQQEHFKDLIYNFNVASNNIQFRTRKGYGNWVVADEQGSNVLESLPDGMFVSAPRPQNVQGLHFIGTLKNKWRCYKDLRLINEPNSSANGNFLMGFKGSQFYEAGFVWAPYQLMYTTPTLNTANFTAQKGMASRYATKMVNQDMYVRINLGA